MKEKVVVALSGGVDSSVAAALAVRAGYEVIGVTLRLKHPDPAFSATQLCVSKNDEAAVDQTVRALGIEHHYLEYFTAFEKKVLRPAALEYGAGRTPNPCCSCNLFVKFGSLVDFADSVSASKVLTGHYAKLVYDSSGISRLYRGDDLRKDQSYFLYRLTRHELARVEFPVGGMEKSAVRAIAAEIGLTTSAKPDSQDACFQVPGECFGETLRRLCNFAAKPGAFLYRGKIVGRHSGIHCYTIGQRKGLGVALGVPAYVAAIDPVTGNIMLETDPAALLRDTFEVENVSWQSGHEPEFRRMAVQIRYRSKAAAAEIESLGGDRYRVHTLQPQRAVTPGQAAVFYRENELLGGGVIANVT